MSVVKLKKIFFLGLIMLANTAFAVDYSAPQVAQLQSDTGKWKIMRVSGLAQIDKIVTAGKYAWAYHQLPDNGGVMIAFYDGAKWHPAQKLSAVAHLDKFYGSSKNSKPAAWVYNSGTYMHDREVKQCAYFNGSEWQDMSAGLEVSGYSFRAAGGRAWQVQTDMHAVRYAMDKNGKATWSKAIPYQSIGEVYPSGDYAISVAATEYQGEGSFYMIQYPTDLTDNLNKPVVLTRCDQTSNSCQNLPFPQKIEASFNKLWTAEMRVYGNRVFVNAMYKSNLPGIVMEANQHYSPDRGKTWKVFKASDWTPVHSVVEGSTYCYPLFSGPGGKESPTGQYSCMDLDSKNPTWATTETTDLKRKWARMYTAADGVWVYSLENGGYLAHNKFKLNKKWINLTPAEADFAYPPVDPFYNFPAVRIISPNKVATCGKRDGVPGYIGLFYNGNAWIYQAFNINTDNFYCRLSGVGELSNKATVTDDANVWLY